jgi:hypothetical protein
MPSLTAEPDVRKARRTTTTPPASEYADWNYAGYYVSDFASNIRRELDRLAGLRENWDREGAPRIDAAIIQAARQFVDELPSDIATVPAVVPIADGNLQFEWNAGNRSLELEISNPKTIHYLKWCPQKVIEEESLFPIGDIDLAVSLIRWFMKGATDV